MAQKYAFKPGSVLPNNEIKKPALGAGFFIYDIVEDYLSS